MEETQPHIPSQDFNLKPGERIIRCTPPLTGGCDRILQELANCHHCLHATHRVIVVTSSSGLERRAALCAHHFAEAARNFPELQRQSVQRSVK
jgi:hypothetical protein